MLSCKKATELIEKRLLVKLSFKENMQLQAHKSMCSACTTYEKQSKRMDELFQSHNHRKDTMLAGGTINEDLKKKIINSLPKN